MLTLIIIIWVIWTLCRPWGWHRHSMGGWHHRPPMGCWHRPMGSWHHPMGGFHGGHVGGFGGGFGGGGHTMGGGAGRGRRECESPVGVESGKAHKGIVPPGTT